LGLTTAEGDPGVLLTIVENAGLLFKKKYQNTKQQGLSLRRGNPFLENGVRQVRSVISHADTPVSFLTGELSLEMDAWIR
jgi:hypothetical protein